ncbi:MAG TPA: hypothetical protein VMT53_23075 [Terriglobales bacterium]|nr:hypothetical protein [Terriglobales bacterium]
MQLKLKTISKSGIAQAITKGEIYRYLYEPEETESICRDILAVESDNQVALRMLGLALADQFCGRSSDRCLEAESVFQKLTDPYERLYCTGLLHERKAKAQLRAGEPLRILVPLLENAMACFEQAETIRPEGNDDSILRWNRCARILQNLPNTEVREGPIELDVADGAPVA